MSTSKLDLIIDKINDLKTDNSDGHEEIKKRLDFTNGNVMKNTAFRIEVSTTIKNLKWLLGLLGIGNIANLIYVIFRH
ncbi:MAG: hypothetical protein NT165_03695 [Candidatus Falkowbacteria bacterium]|nr:hypothetical protein [Candidatus Falkowbacteria bacterium]